MHLMQMQTFVIVVCSLWWISDAGSPFKNRNDRGSGISGGVMMNTASPAALLNPFLGSHGHTIRPQTYAFGDKFPQYQTATVAAPTFVPSHNFHQHQNKFHGHYPPHPQQAHKRQFRNPFDVIFEWRQLDFDYPTFLDRQVTISIFLPSFLLFNPKFLLV